MDPAAPHRLPTASPPTPPAPASTHTTTTRITEQPFPGRGGQPPHTGASPRIPARPDPPHSPDPPPTPQAKTREHPHDTIRTREPPHRQTRHPANVASRSPDPPKLLGNHVAYHDQTRVR